MSFDAEFEQALGEMTLEELEATKETFAQAYAKICRTILERMTMPTSSTTPERWRFNRN